MESSGTSCIHRYLEQQNTVTGCSAVERHLIAITRPPQPSQKKEARCPKLCSRTAAYVATGSKSTTSSRCSFAGLRVATTSAHITSCTGQELLRSGINFSSWFQLGVAYDHALYATVNDRIRGQISVVVDTLKLSYHSSNLALAETGYWRVVALSLTLSAHIPITPGVTSDSFGHYRCVLRPRHHQPLTGRRAMFRGILREVQGNRKSGGKGRVGDAVTARNAT